MRLTPQWSLKSRRLADSTPTGPFNIADLFTAGSYGLYMSVTDNVMYDVEGSAASINEAVYEAYFNYAVGSGVAGSTASFRQITTANQPVLKQDGSVRYLDFDGVNDGLVSRSTVDIGTTDAITVIAGILRDQNVNMEDIVGWGSNPADVNKFRLCATFDASTNNAAFASRGSTGDAGARAADTLTNTKYVLTGLGDISADTSIIRRNGVQMAASATDQGTGNYTANQNLHLGSRGGSSRYFNGRLYALVVINRVLSGAELANAEAWVASKTGITI